MASLNNSITIHAVHRTNTQQHYRTCGTQDQHTTALPYMRYTGPTHNSIATQCSNMRINASSLIRYIQWKLCTGHSGCCRQVTALQRYTYYCCFGCRVVAAMYSDHYRTGSTVSMYLCTVYIMYTHVLYIRMYYTALMLWGNTPTTMTSCYDKLGDRVPREVDNTNKECTTSNQ